MKELIGRRRIVKNLLQPIILRISRSIPEPIKDKLLSIGLIRFVRNSLYSGNKIGLYKIPGESFGLLINIAHGGERMFLTKKREGYVVDFLKKLVRPDWVVLDIGAYIGFYTVLLAKLARYVIAFEPVPELADRIKETCRLNQITNVKVENAALGKSDGNAKLFIERDQSGGIGQSSSIKRDWVGEEAIDVPVIKLDTYVRQVGLNLINLVKIDVEGAELEVLLGAVETLRRCKPIVVCEFNDQLSFEKARELLLSLGYRVEVIGHMSSGFHVVGRCTGEAVTEGPWKELP
mgnify:CR=1 FL=1